MGSVEADLFLVSQHERQLVHRLDRLGELVIRLHRDRVLIVGLERDEPDIVMRHDRHRAAGEEVSGFHRVRSRIQAAALSRASSSVGQYAPCPGKTWFFRTDTAIDFDECTVPQRTLLPPT